MLRSGYALCAEIEELKMKGRKNGKTEVFRFYRVTDTDRGCRMHFCPERSFPLGAVTALKLKKDDLFICRGDALTDKIGVTLARRHQLRVI